MRLLSTSSLTLILQDQQTVSTMETNPAVTSTQAALADRESLLSIQRQGHRHRNYAHFSRFRFSSDVNILECLAHIKATQAKKGAVPRPNPSIQSSSQNTNAQNQPDGGDQNSRGNNDGNASDSDGEDDQQRQGLAQVTEDGFSRLQALQTLLETSDPVISNRIRWLRIEDPDNFVLFCHLAALKALQQPWDRVLKRIRSNVDESIQLVPVIQQYYQKVVGRPRKASDQFINLAHRMERWDSNLARFDEQHRRWKLIPVRGDAPIKQPLEFHIDIRKRFNTICSTENTEFFWWAEQAILRVLSRFDAHREHQPLRNTPFMPYTAKHLIGVVEHIYSQLWTECSSLTWSEDTSRRVYSLARRFIRTSLTEDEETKRMVDVAVIVDCFVNKVWVDVGRGICKALKAGQTKCSTDDLEIPKILRHSRAENNLKDTYKIWLVSSHKSDPNAQAAALIEADPGPLQYQGVDKVNPSELSRVCASVYDRLGPARLPNATFFSDAFPEPGKPYLLVFEGPWCIKVVKISTEEIIHMGWHPLAKGQSGYGRFYAIPMGGVKIPVLTSMEETMVQMMIPDGRLVSRADVAKQMEDEG